MMGMDKEGRWGLGNHRVRARVALGASRVASLSTSIRTVQIGSKIAQHAGPF